MEKNSEKLRVEHLTFTYPTADTPALCDISLSVSAGAFVVLCGRSGCGKSTLLRHFKKSLFPYGKRSGGIFYEGRALAEEDERRQAQAIGFVRQDPDAQIVTDKVWHELAFGLENLGLATAVIRRRVAEMASYFGMQRLFRRDVATLSGGQKQLLNLASVMVMQPEVLILDEPASQLDPIAAEDFLETVFRINRELGTTVIISEHRLETVFPMADQVIVMERGRILTKGTPAAVAQELATREGGKPHPMYRGMPAVMRAFPPELVKGDLPLTLREGRLVLRELLEAEGAPKTRDAAAGTAVNGSAQEIGTQDRNAQAKAAPESLSERLVQSARKKAAPESPPERLVQSADKKVSGADAASCACAEGISNTERPVLTVKNISFRYERDGEDVLRALSLTLIAGHLHCLLGGNGSGKSTLLKVIAGILHPQHGKMRAAGEPSIALVPQNPQALFTEITVEEEMMEATAFLSLSTDERLRRTQEMLTLMELEHLSKQNPYDLSGGEQERLAIGKVLTLKPQILLLDEPTKGLDPFFKETLGEILRRLTRAGVTVLMVSHDIEFCARFGDRCGLFFDGEITSAGRTRAFFSGNSFYTTTANRLMRGRKESILMPEEAQAWIREKVTARGER